MFGIGLVTVSILLAVGERQEEHKSTVTVSGNSEITAEPDKAEVYVRIESTEDTAEDAKDENARVSEAVINALKGIGVDTGNIETAQYRLQRKENYNPRTGKLEFEGYTAYHLLKITTKDIDGVGRIIDAAVDAGANGLERVSFGLTKEQERLANDRALKEASEVARDKAASLAASLGVKLGSIVSVAESNTRQIPYTYYPQVAEMKSASTEITPQSITVQGHVSLVYEIE